MSTFMAKAENVERKWYVLDAAGKPLGTYCCNRCNAASRQAQDHVHSRMLTAAIS